jgi:hypothetical protein
MWQAYACHIPQKIGNYPSFRESSQNTFIVVALSKKASLIVPTGVVQDFGEGVR